MHHTAPELVLKELRRYRRLQAICGGVVVMGGLAGFGLIRYYFQPETSAFLQVCALVAVIIGGYALVDAWRGLDPERHELIKLLRYQPENIVWVYSYLSVNMPYGVKLFRMATLYLNDRYGKTYSMQVRASALEKINKRLTDHLPHATFGFSVQKEQCFRADPKMLYRD